MANDTLLNATLNASNATQIDVGTATQLFFSVVIPEIFSRFWIFVSAPFLYPEMWWMLIHLLLTFVLFEFYFERHRGEDLGWTAALANSIVLIFISMELLRSIYGHGPSPFAVVSQIVRDLFTIGLSEHMGMVVLILLLGALGIATAVINYFHFLPRRIAFLVSGHKTVNLLAYFLIVVVWRYVHADPMPLDFVTFVALLLYGALLWFALLVINHFRKGNRQYER